MTSATSTASAVDQFFNTMGRYETLAPAETIELSRKVQSWQQHPNGVDNCPPIIKRIGIAARNKLVRHNLRLVVKIWSDNYSTRVLPNSPNQADILQMGAKDLVRAAEKYDGATGYTFSTYACNWIHKGMKDYLGSEERLVRMPTNNYFLVKAAMLMQVNREADGLPEYSMDELIEEMSKTRRAKNLPTPKQMGEWIQAYRETNARSFSEQVGEDSELGDLVAMTNTNEAQSDELLEETRKAMAYLTQFERKVIEARFFRPRSSVGHKYVSRVLRSTEAEVRDAEARAFKRIKLMVAR